MEGNGPVQENKMGTKPVLPLLLSMSVPIMLSMLVQALYNVVDSIFVSRVSENALTAVSIAFPVQNLMIGVATGIAVGINALLSRALGEKRPETANRVAMQGLLMEIVSCVLFMILGITAMNWFIRTQTTETEIIEYGTQYLTIVCLLSGGMFMQVTFDRLLQSTGRTIYTMFTQGIGAIINIVMDPILIFGLGPFPAMGVAGAAYATVFGQIVAAVISIIFNVTRNAEITLKKENLKPDGRIIRNILMIGVPSILMVSVGSVMNYCMNQILFAFSATAVAVFGVYYKLQSFVFMPVFGLNNGMIPVLAYNYGARYQKRMTQTIYYSIGIAVVIMLIGALIFQIFPAHLFGLFDASDEMIRMGVPALRTISISFLLAGVCVVSTSVCQALGAGLYSLIVSAGRQLVVLVPSAWLLAQTGVLNNVWWSYPIAEVVSLLLCIYFVRRTLKKLVWSPAE